MGLRGEGAGGRKREAALPPALPVPCPGVAWATGFVGARGMVKSLCIESSSREGRQKQNKSSASALVCVRMCVAREPQVEAPPPLCHSGISGVVQREAVSKSHMVTGRWFVVVCWASGASSWGP